MLALAGLGPLFIEVVSRLDTYVASHSLVKRLGKTQSRRLIGQLFLRSQSIFS